MRRSTWLSSLVLVLACGPGAPGDDATAASSEDSTSGAGQTSVQGTSTSTATSPETTTTGDGTASSGATADASTTTGPPLPPPCVPETDWNEEHFDCLVDWPAATQVQGVGPAAPLGVVTRIYFGVLDQACIEGLELEPLRVGDPLMPQAVLYRTAAECGPEQWPGTYELDGRLADDTPFVTTMTIDGFAGDWLATDPVDPPRISGTFSGDLVGVFEAVHCAEIDVYIDNCG